MFNIFTWFKRKKEVAAYKRTIRQPHIQEFRTALKNELRRQVPGEEFDIVIVPNTDAVDGVGFQLVTESSRAVVAWSEMQYALQESLGSADFHHE